MPIKAICPECETTYQLADQQAGKKVRCKNCQTVFAVAAARTKSNAVTGRRGAPRRSDDYDEEDDAFQGEPRRGPARREGKKNSLPWILGGALIGGGLLFLLCGGIGAWWYFREPAEEPPKFVQSKEVQQPPADQAAPAAPPAPAPQVIPPPPQDGPPQEGEPVKTAEPAKTTESSPAAAEDAKPRAPASNNGELTREARDRVKRATVYLRVKMADGTQASGTGFFGCKEARNIVLTNAHVVGMLSPESARPQKVEVVVNSGQPDEWTTEARVLGVDRVSDLAVLDIGKPPHQAPEPLAVRSARDLQELDRVYIFGFPLGEQLGKEISINETKVTSMRHKGKQNERIQVGEGMNPGNSGGPVVDYGGVVVGVAVAGIPGRAINFAIPGDRVDNILNGRISDLIVNQPYYTGDNKVAVPVVMDMIDPRNLIKEVGLEVWTGNKPPDPKSGSRPASEKQPSPQAGDSQHVYYKLKYIAPGGKADIVLPPLPQGKVYWHQPKWITAKGETRWAPAHPMQMPSAPVTRRQVNLALHYTQATSRTMDLSIDNTFKVSENDDADFFRIHTAAQFSEKVALTGATGTLLNLKYKYAPSRDLITPDGKSSPNPALEKFKKDLPRMLTSVIQLDKSGNITHQSVDMNNRNLWQLRQTDPQSYQEMLQFHEMIQQALDTLSVSLPPSGTAKPLESWKAERHMPVDTPVRAIPAKLNATYTYLGTRKRDGREEAVIGLDGSVNSQDDFISGRVDGQIMVDLNSGQILLAETTAKLQLKATLARPGEPPREFRVLDTIKFRMQRKM